MRVCSYLRVNLSSRPDATRTFENALRYVLLFCRRRLRTALAVAVSHCSDKRHRISKPIGLRLQPLHATAPWTRLTLRVFYYLTREGDTVEDMFMVFHHFRFRWCPKRAAPSETPENHYTAASLRRMTSSPQTLKSDSASCIRGSFFRSLGDDVFLKFQKRLNQRRLFAAVSAIDQRSKSQSSLESELGSRFVDTSGPSRQVFNVHSRCGAV